MKNTFADLNLIPELLAALQEEGISEPTVIQEKTIPLIFKGMDVVGQSETGTGKTLAYLLPLFQKIDVQRQVAQGLILCPTHELAVQIQRQGERLAQNSGMAVKSAILIGNVNIARQIEKLKEKPHLLIGSSGRILELVQKRKINTQTIKMIVLDEADRLLDEQHRKIVEDLIKTAQKDRQLLSFSATVTGATLERLKSLAPKLQYITVGEETRIAPTLTHHYFLAEQRDKFEVLRKLVRILNPERALVFINSSDKIETTVEKLRFHGLEAEGLHGSALKVERGKALNDFRDGKIQLLVASDLAARGLHIGGIKVIFNLDLPEDPQLYLHRAGRAGRAGEKGDVLSIVTEQELHLLRKLENRFQIRIEPKDMYQGVIIEAKSTKKRPASTVKTGSPVRRPQKKQDVEIGDKNLRRASSTVKPGLKTEKKVTSVARPKSAKLNLKGKKKP